MADAVNVADGSDDGDEKVAKDHGALFVNGNDGVTEERADEDGSSGGAENGENRAT